MPAGHCARLGHSCSSEIVPRLLRPQRRRRGDATRPDSRLLHEPWRRAALRPPAPGRRRLPAVSLSPGVVASLWGGEASLPGGPLPTSRQIDLEHRLLIAAGRGGADPHEIVERATVLAAGVLEQAELRRVAASRPAARASAACPGRRCARGSGRDPERCLPDLARLLAVSPHHLSRVFRSASGHTISRHRMRLRARSHLRRVIRAETGQTPRRCDAPRVALARGSDGARWAVSQAAPLSRLRGQMRREEQS